MHLYISELLLFCVVDILPLLRPRCTADHIWVINNCLTALRNEILLIQRTVFVHQILVLKPGAWLGYLCATALALLLGNTHTHLFNVFFLGLPRWAVTRKVKPIWILLKQETVSGSGISWAICKSAPRSRQITTPAPHHSVFYRPDALPAAQPTVSKHWRQRTVAGEILPKNR